MCTCLSTEMMRLKWISKKKWLWFKIYSELEHKWNWQTHLYGVTQFGEIDARLFVVNTDDSGGSGEHWLAVYKSDDKTYLFDPYNLPRDIFPNIPVITSPVQLQSFTSILCGDYCIAFAMALCQGVSLDNFLSYLKNTVFQLQCDHRVRDTTPAQQRFTPCAHTSICSVLSAYTFLKSLNKSARSAGLNLVILGFQSSMINKVLKIKSLVLLSENAIKQLVTVYTLFGQTFW